MREKGIIKRYIPEKGYGFIMQPGKDDRFFHISDVIDGEALVDQILPCANVEFTPIERGRGPAAIEVELV